MITLLFSYQNSNISDCTVYPALIHLVVHIEESLFQFFLFSQWEESFSCVLLSTIVLWKTEWQHLAFHVGGTYRLLKDSIWEADVQEAGALLKLFCAQAPWLYGWNKHVSNLCQFTFSFHVTVWLVFQSTFYW